MSLQSKLEQHLAQKNASWRADAATWTEANEPRVLYWTDGPLSASHVVDAHVRAQREGAHPTLAYSGATTEIARAAAARFGVTLFNAAALPEPARAPVVDEGILIPVMEGAPRHPAPIPMVPGLVAQMLEPLLPAHLDAPLLEAHAEPAPAAAPVVTLTPAPAATPVAALAPALGVQAAVTLAPAPVATPVVTPVPAPVAAPATAPPAPPTLPDVDPRFPWPVGPPREPSFSLRVPAEEFARMPWNAPHVLLQAAPVPGEEQHDLVVTERKPLGGMRPTQVPHWGLPWPRPVNPADGLAIADPKLWGAQPRLLAVREDLDRVGGGSFGAVKPEGSNWLKRLQSGL